MWNWLAQTAPDALLNVSQLGMAGLMGGLWWWERKYSRQREDQLTAAHEAILQQREHLDALLETVRKNTAAIAEFTAVQQELVTLLRGRAPEFEGARAGAT